MSKRSITESGIRSILSRLLGGERHRSLTDALRQVTESFKGTLDVLIVNINHVIDSVCEQSQIRDRSRVHMVSIAKLSVRYVSEQASAAKAANVVVCCDGALPFALRRGVKVDNCNYEAFHRSGSRDWSGGDGGRMPYPHAAYLMGQAMSPGSHICGSTLALWRRKKLGDMQRGDAGEGGGETHVNWNGGGGLRGVRDHAAGGATGETSFQLGAEQVVCR